MIQEIKVNDYLFLAEIDNYNNPPAKRQFGEELWAVIGYYSTLPENRSAEGHAGDDSEGYVERDDGRAAVTDKREGYAHNR